MAITVNSSDDSGRQPSAPALAGTVNADLDASYPLTATDGYPLTDDLPDGVTVVHSEWVCNYDGASKRWFRIVDVGGVPTLKAYADTNDCPGAEEGDGTNLAGHTGLDVGWFGK